MRERFEAVLCSTRQIRQFLSELTDPEFDCWVHWVDAEKKKREAAENENKTLS